MSERYEAKGYGDTPIGFGTSLAVLVIDFQRGFVDPQFQLGGSPMMEPAIKRTSKLLAVSRQHDIPVANCYVAYPNSGCAPYWKISSVTRDFLRGRPEAELDPRIVDPSYDYIGCRDAGS